MNDKMLVERVIAWLDGGCSSWNVPSSDIRQMATRIEALEAALRDMVDAYVCNVDSYRTGGFYSDPRKDDCVINAEAALESQP